MAVAVRRVDSGEAAVYKRVRLAALQDTPSAFGSTYEREIELDDAEWTERTRAGAEGVERVTFLAVDGEDVVGLVGGYRWPHPSTEVDLISMWSAPAVRRQGVGRALVHAVLDWASTIGATSVSLWVTHGNEPACALYEHMGFATTGDHQPHPSDPCKDEIRMIRRC